MTEFSISSLSEGPNGEESEVKADIFANFTVTPEEVEGNLEEVVIRQRRRNPEICICGHPAGKHLVGPMGTTCVPAKQYCPCKTSRPVCSTSDTRHFLFKTKGWGSDHALLKGLLKAARSGAEVEWIGDMKCDKCGAIGPADPICVTQDGRYSNEPTGFDVLLCVSCRLEVS